MMQDPICLWIGRKYCPIGIGVAYIEVRRIVILSCFFLCVRFMVSCPLPVVYFVYVKLVEALHYKPEGRGFDPDGLIGIFQ